jgi:CheY-like chemotaxis protein
VRKTDDSFELVRQVNRWLKPKDSLQNLRAPSLEPRSSPESGDRRKPRSAPPTAANAPAGVERLSRPPPKTSGASRVLPIVLFIDERMDALSEYRKDVQGEAYRADFALSAQQALRHLRGEERPELIVTSLEPTGMDVFERALALDGSWRERFVFVTSTSKSVRASEFLAAFRGTVLSRPVEATVLRQTLRRLLGADAADRQRDGTKS